MLSARAKPIFDSHADVPQKYCTMIHSVELCACRVERCSFATPSSMLSHDLEYTVEHAGAIIHHEVHMPALRPMYALISRVPLLAVKIVFPAQHRLNTSQICLNQSLSQSPLLLVLLTTEQTSFLVAAHPTQKRNFQCEPEVRNRNNVCKIKKRRIGCYLPRPKHLDGICYE